MKLGRAAFALTLIVLGILGLIKGNFAPIWQPVPKGVPAREALAYLSGFVALGCGAGLLWPRTSAAAARLLLFFLLAWMLAFRAPPIVLAPASQETWSGLGETAVLAAGAWVLWGKGLRVARLLYGLALIPFGLAHFRFPNETASLVPGWLPFHVAWAYLTGCTYIAAGAAVVAGVRARLAAILSTWQMAGFTALVWAPIVLAGANDFQWSEFLLSIALTTAAWAVADSYRK